MGERADGSWSAFEVAVNVARQNGKGTSIEARELAGLFLLGEKLILHSAHEFKDLDLTTPVLTANRGWSTMGDLSDGDEVFAPDGQPTKIVAAHPILTSSTWSVYGVAQRKEKEAQAKRRKIRKKR